MENFRTPKRVFLGGTYGSDWRNKMMEYLQAAGLEYFNPVVKKWNDKAPANELRERENCDFCLYTITPKMTGTYSIAEVVDDSNKRPHKTVMVLLEKDGELKFSESQWMSLNAVASLVKRNGGVIFYSLYVAAVALAASETHKDKKQEENIVESNLKLTEPYQLLVLKEKKELDNKLVKLKDFTNTNDYAKLSATNQSLLMVQLEAMTSYSNVLSRRIKLYEVNPCL